MLEKVQYCVIEEFDLDHAECGDWATYHNVLKHLFGIYLETSADATYVIFQVNSHGNEERIKGILLEIAHLSGYPWGFIDWLENNNNVLAALA